MIIIKLMRNCLQVGALIFGRLNCDYVSKVGDGVERALVIRTSALQVAASRYILCLKSFLMQQNKTLDLLIFKILAVEPFMK